VTDSSFDERMSQNLMDGRSLVRLLDQHALDELVELGREVLRHALVLSFDDALGQLVKRLGVEGRLQGGHFVEKHAE